MCCVAHAFLALTMFTISYKVLLLLWHLLHVMYSFLQDFKTVMSALKSNNERWGIMDVTLVFRKPTADEVNLCEKAGAA